MEEDKKLSAISKIQRQARRNRAMKAARAEQQWRLFADLDTQDEVEMLHLAVFMQTLLDTVPRHIQQSKGNAPIDHDEILVNLIHDEEEAGMETDESAASAVDEEPMIKLENIVTTNTDSFAKQTHRTIKNQQTGQIEYDITDRKVFDSAVFQHVLEIYRHNGRLSRDSVIKILRKSYKTLINQPNIIHMGVGKLDKLTVVGDLHGQLSDLLYIFEESGPPSLNNKFVFNGDFVDRGPNGLEIFVLLLLAYVTEGPEVISLNRGNHEDRTVCRVYGFEEEVSNKYPNDPLLYEMLMEIFNQLTLFTIINDDVFIVHGGLFHNSPHVTYEDLQDIPRTDYFVKPPQPYPEVLKYCANEKERRIEYLKQLQREALWSDPLPNPSAISQVGTNGNGIILPSERGVGVRFDAVACRRFMQQLQLSMIIRSHECVKSGCEFPYLPDPLAEEAENTSSNKGKHHQLSEPADSQKVTKKLRSNAISETFDAFNFRKLISRKSSSKKRAENDLNAFGEEDEFFAKEEGPPLLCTLFSASNYCHGDNFGAIIVFINHDIEGGQGVESVNQGNYDEDDEMHRLHYVIKRYKTSPSNYQQIVAQNNLSLKELILKKKSALLTAFQVVDEKNEGLISRFEWAEIMSRITNIKVLWLSLINTIVPGEYLTPSSVRYREFLSTFSLVAKTNTTTASDGTVVENNTNQYALVMDTMYGQRKQLETVFYYFDTNGDGVISREEFREGCAKLNELLHPDCQLTNIDRTLEMMDFDGSGTIDINEFFETFRILDAKDGTVDGVISIAKQQG